MLQSSASIGIEEDVEAGTFEIEDLNTSASNSNMADPSQSMPSDPSKHCQELTYRLDALRRKESFFDVTVSVKDKVFKAHRLVLAAASPFFLSLLVSDMKEGKEQGPVVQKPINVNPRFKINQGVYFSTPKCCSTLIFGKTLHRRKSILKNKNKQKKLSPKS